MTDSKAVSLQEFFWRRALAGTALAILAGLGWGAFSRLAPSAAPSQASTAGCAQGTCTVSVAARAGAIYVAKPGDTVWSIALRYSHGQDPRPLEYDLEAQLAGGMLQPGDTLRVP